MEGIIGVAIIIFFILSVYEFNRSFRDVKTRLDRIEEKLDKFEAKAKK
jgi:tetrahydromethanopterin S-methyltransferase subunit G